ncbi:MAG: hypothetical protein HQ581_08530 [Planctomycetes bacterium]|nr:hypothetical protein [Planctomycetota bacterium]
MTSSFQFTLRDMFFWCVFLAVVLSWHIQFTPYCRPSSMYYPGPIGFCAVLFFGASGLLARRNSDEAIPLALFAVGWFLAIANTVKGMAFTLGPLFRHHSPQQLQGYVDVYFFSGVTLPFLVSLFVGHTLATRCGQLFSRRWRLVRISLYVAVIDLLVSYWLFRVSWSIVSSLMR